MTQITQIVGPLLVKCPSGTKRRRQAKGDYSAVVAASSKLEPYPNSALNIRGRAGARPSIS